MRYRDSIFASLLKPIWQRQFKTIVQRHDGDAYDEHTPTRARLPRHLQLQ